MQTDSSLFDLPLRMKVYLPGPAPPPITVEVATPITWEAVRSFLQERGLCVQEVSKSRREIIHGLQARMVYRTRENVYQAPACTIPLFGRSHAAHFFRGVERTVDTAQVVTWEIHDPDLLAPLLAPFSDAHSMCIGQSKAMGNTKLNPFVSVISTLFTLVASSVCKGGRDIMYLNALYVLMSDVGEIDYPKTKEKRAMAISYEDEQRLRRVMQRDIESMAEADFPLSSGFLRMLGAGWSWKADAVRELERAHQTAAATKAAEFKAAQEAASGQSAQEQTAHAGSSDDGAGGPIPEPARALAPSTPPQPQAPRVSARAARAVRNELEPRYDR